MDVTQEQRETFYFYMGAAGCQDVCDATEILRRAIRLGNKYVHLCNGTLRVPAKYSGDDADYNYLDDLENELERRILEALPDASVYFSRDPRGRTVAIITERVNIYL